MKKSAALLFLLISFKIFSQNKETETPLPLGVFSVSLNVKNLQKSKEFYENLGFSQMGGDMKQNYLIMKNGTTIIGIFQGMFEGNILTFNPGWDEKAKEVNPFTDVREIQKRLKSNQIKLNTEADEKTKGPAYIELTDPDGNKILIDQHR
ncbi:VOC family protein [Chryseobacterium sp. KACC 21268]|nr:VOC family protein [Chryseobacterium sp. KACC 21268]